VAAGGALRGIPSFPGPFFSTEMAASRRAGREGFPTPPPCLPAVGSQRTSSKACEEGAMHSRDGILCCPCTPFSSSSFFRMARQRESRGRSTMALPVGGEVSGQRRGSGLKTRKAPENSLPPDAENGIQPKWLSSKSTKTGAWSEGRSFLRTSRSISAEVSAGSREEAIRIRSIRRPMLRRNIPCR